MAIDILELLSSPNPLVFDRLVSLFRSMTSEDITKMLVSPSHKYDGNFMGWFVLPMLKERLETDPSLFNELLKGVSNPIAGDAYQAPVLEVLDKIAWKNGGEQWDSYCSFLRSLVENSSLETSLSVKAIRLLDRQNNTLIYDTFETACKSDTPEILNAIGEVISLWLRKKEEVPDIIIYRLTAYAEMNPVITLSLPGLLRAIAIHAHTMHSESSIAILKFLCTKITTPQERDLMLATVGTWVSPSILGILLQDFIKQPTDTGVNVIKGLLIQKPAILSELYGSGLYLEYLACISEAPQMVSDDDRLHVRSLIDTGNPQISSVAFPVYSRCGSTPLQDAELNIKHNTLSRRVVRFNSQIISEGFSTGFQVADAIYKELDPGISQVFGQHWHAGLFAGFGPGVKSGIFKLSCIQVANTGWFSDIIEVINAEGNFRSRSANLSSIMKMLTDELSEKFSNGNKELFRGARSAYNVPISTRKKIIATAFAWLHKDITYCYDQQLDYKGSSWDGSIDDIDNSRCDGFVEYCYEKNDVKVCSGLFSQPGDHLWNISHPDTLCIDNHSVFHDGSTCATHYKKGDLCPRIQAGDVGNDTTFRKIPPAKPSVSIFEAELVELGNVSLSFKINAICSECVYVRLMVQKVGQKDSWFVRSSEDVWCLKRVDIRSFNLRDAELIWTGETVDALSHTICSSKTCRHYPEKLGPNYHGINGMYLFRLQCIDEGGNVSDELGQTVDVVWGPAVLNINVLYDFDGEKAIPNAHEVEAKYLDFGQLHLGYTPTFTLHFFHSGSGKITINNGIVTGDFNSNNLSIPTEQLILSQSTPGAIFGCSFTPDHAGHYEGTLTFASDAPNCPNYLITLKADVVGPQVEISPSKLDFGDIVVGNYKSSENVIFVTNTGTYDAYIDVRQDFEDEEPFGQFSCFSRGDVLHLSPGETSLVYIYFQPTQVGPARATLILDVHPPRLVNLTQTTRVNLTGSGIELLPAIQITPTAIDFGRVALRQEGNVNHQIRNTGEGDLRITALYVEPQTNFFINHWRSIDWFKYYSYNLDDLPKVLAPGELLEITMLFVPDRIGQNLQANIIIESNDPSKPSLQVPLTGICSGCWVDIQPELIDFGEVPSTNQSVSKLLKLISKGVDPVTIYDISLEPSTPEFTLDIGTSLPFTLSPGQELSLLVYFIPSKPGDYQTYLGVKNNGINDPHVRIKGSVR